MLSTVQLTGTVVLSGDLIKQQRRLKGMMQKQLAESVGVSELSICLYELGKRTPSEDAVRQIADAREIRLEGEFLGR